jgi:hypothetical protein
MSSSAKELREFAQECLRFAGETRSEKHRQVLLEMAESWFQASLEVERNWALRDEFEELRSRLGPAK